MATYLYCILAPARAEALRADLMGIGGATVRSLVVPEAAGLEAWVATIVDARFRVTGDALAKLALLHNEVVDAALATGRTPLPARFATCFADDAACIADLAKRYAELHAGLERVANAVEMAVLLVPTNGSRPAGDSRPLRNEPSAGRRYLEVVRKRTRNEEQLRIAAEQLAARVTAAVKGIVRGETRVLSPQLLSIAHLVGRADLQRYRDTLAGVTPGPQFKILVAGPRAPYSFATD